MPVEARGSWYRLVRGGERGRYRLSVILVPNTTSFFAKRPDFGCVYLEYGSLWIVGGIAKLQGQVWVVEWVSWEGGADRGGQGKVLCSAKDSHSNRFQPILSQIGKYSTV